MGVRLGPSGQDTKCAGLPFQSLQASLEAAQSYAGTASLAKEKETPEKEDHQTITAIPQSLSNSLACCAEYLRMLIGLMGVAKQAVVSAAGNHSEAGGGFQRKFSAQAPLAGRLQPA